MIKIKQRIMQSVKALCVVKPRVSVAQLWDHLEAKNLHRVVKSIELVEEEEPCDVGDDDDALGVAYLGFECEEDAIFAKWILGFMVEDDDLLMLLYIFPEEEDS